MQHFFLVSFEQRNFLPWIYDLTKDVIVLVMSIFLPLTGVTRILDLIAGE